MTPKAKAENLIEKFIPNTRIWNDEKKLWEDCIESAKRCTLIAVDELLDDDVYDMSEQPFEKRIEYWQEVKQELLKIK